MYFFHGTRYQSRIWRLAAGSRTTIQRTGWRLPPWGAKRAASSSCASSSSGTSSFEKWRQVPDFRMTSWSSIAQTSEVLGGFTTASPSATSTPSWFVQVSPIVARLRSLLSSATSTLLVIVSPM